MKPQASKLKRKIRKQLKFIKNEEKNIKAGRQKNSNGSNY